MSEPNADFALILTKLPWLGFSLNCCGKSLKTFSQHRLFQRQDFTSLAREVQVWHSEAPQKVLFSLSDRQSAAIFQ